MVTNGTDRIAITGTGSYIPSKALTNHDLEKMVDTTDEWITSRTGIKKRHVAADNAFDATTLPVGGGLLVAKKR